MPDDYHGQRWLDARDVMRLLGIGSSTTFKRFLKANPSFPAAKAVKMGGAAPSLRWEKLKVLAWMELYPDATEEEAGEAEE